MYHISCQCVCSNYRKLFALKVWSLIFTWWNILNSWLDPPVMVVLCSQTILVAWRVPLLLETLRDLLPKTCQGFWVWTPSFSLFLVVASVAWENKSASFTVSFIVEITSRKKWTTCSYYLGPMLQNGPCQEAAMRCKVFNGTSVTCRI